jgi:hypothetical protein
MSLKAPFKRLSESEEIPPETKVSLSAHIALYNPVELQHNVNKAILRLRGSLKPHIIQGPILALQHFLNEASITFGNISI